jgi:hypothetical protein
MSAVLEFRIGEFDRLSPVPYVVSELASRLDGAYCIPLNQYR